MGNGGVGVGGGRLGAGGGASPGVLCGQSSHRQEGRGREACPQAGAITCESIHLWPGFCGFCSVRWGASLLADRGEGEEMLRIRAGSESVGKSPQEPPAHPQEWSCRAAGLQKAPRGLVTMQTVGPKVRPKLMPACLLMLGFGPSGSAPAPPSSAAAPAHLSSPTEQLLVPNT